MADIFIFRCFLLFWLCCMCVCWCSYVEQELRLPKLGRKRCRGVVVNAFQNQTEMTFLEVFRRQFLKNLKKHKLQDIPDDPREQDRLILEVLKVFLNLLNFTLNTSPVTVCVYHIQSEQLTDMLWRPQAYLTYDEFTDFVQEITNLRLAHEDLQNLFDEFSTFSSPTWAGHNGNGNGNAPTGSQRAVHLKSFITHFNNYTEERFAYLKSYILNPYHRDMTFAARIPEVGLDRAKKELQQKYRDMPDNLTLYVD